MRKLSLAGLSPRIVIFVVVMLLSFVLSSCGGGGGTTPKPNPSQTPEVRNVSVSIVLPPGTDSKGTLTTTASAVPVSVLVDDVIAFGEGVTLSIDGTQLSPEAGFYWISAATAGEKFIAVNVSGVEPVVTTVAPPVEKKKKNWWERLSDNIAELWGNGGSELYSVIGGWSPGSGGDGDNGGGSGSTRRIIGSASARLTIIRGGSDEPGPPPDDDPANVKPSVSVSASPTSGVAPLQVDFVAVGSDTDGSIVRYNWDFGDGTTMLDVDSAIGHVYNEAGTFTATVTATDNDGGTNTASVTIKVNPASEEPSAWDGVIIDIRPNSEVLRTLSQEFAASQEYNVVLLTSEGEEAQVIPETVTWFWGSLEYGRDVIPELEVTEQAKAVMIYSAFATLGTYTLRCEVTGGGRTLEDEIEIIVVE